MNEIRFSLGCTSRIFRTSRWAATQRPCRTCHRPHHRPLTGRPAAATGQPIRRCSTRPHRRWMSTSPAPRPPLRRRCLPSPSRPFRQRRPMVFIIITRHRRGTKPKFELDILDEFSRNHIVPFFVVFYEFIDTFNGIYSVYMLYTLVSFLYSLLLCLYSCFIWIFCGNNHYTNIRFEKNKIISLEQHIQFPQTFQLFMKFFFQTSRSLVPFYGVKEEMSLPSSWHLDSVHTHPPPLHADSRQIHLKQGSPRPRSGQQEERIGFHFFSAPSDKNGPFIQSSRWQDNVIVWGWKRITQNIYAPLWFSFISTKKEENSNSQRLATST